MWQFLFWYNWCKMFGVINKRKSIVGVLCPDLPSKKGTIKNLKICYTWKSWFWKERIHWFRQCFNWKTCFDSFIVNYIFHHIFINFFFDIEFLLIFSSHIISLLLFITLVHIYFFHFFIYSFWWVCDLILKNTYGSNNLSMDYFHYY